MKILKYIFYAIAILVMKISAESGLYIGLIPAFVLFLYAGRLSKAIFGEDPMTPKVDAQITQPKPSEPKKEPTQTPTRKYSQDSAPLKKGEPPTAKTTEPSHATKIENVVSKGEENEIKDKLRLLEQSLSNELLTQVEFDTKASKLIVQLKKIQAKNQTLLKEQKEEELMKRIRVENKEKIDLLQKLLSVGELTEVEFMAKETKLLMDARAAYLKEMELVDPSNFKIVREGQLYGYADQDKNIVIEYQFEDAFPFSEGLASVKLNGKKGFIDKTGIIVIKCIYDTATYFKGEKAEVSIANETFMINKEGKRI